MRILIVFLLLGFYANPALSVSTPESIVIAEESAVLAANAVFCGASSQDVSNFSELIESKISKTSKSDIEVERAFNLFLEIYKYELRKNHYRTDNIDCSETLSLFNQREQQKTSKQILQSNHDKIIIGIIVFLGFYLLPTIVCFFVNPKRLKPVFWINLIFGLTGLGWFIALLIALVKFKPNITNENVLVSSNNQFEYEQEYEYEYEEKHEEKSFCPRCGEEVLSFASRCHKCRYKFET